MSNWTDFQRFVNLSDDVAVDDILSDTVIIGSQKFYNHEGKIFLEPVDGSADGQEIALKEAKKRAVNR